MRKKTTSQIICQNFKLGSNETIFQDYKCTLKASVTFFGRLYVGEDHFLFISNMFGIVKKCIIEIQRVKKVQVLPNGSVLVVESIKQAKDIKDNNAQSQYVFGSFKNDNAVKLMQALWKRQKIVGDILKTEDEELVTNDAMLQNQRQNANSSERNSKAMMEEGKVQANFFNNETVQNQRQKIAQIILPCSVQQYYHYFLANQADLYPRKKHLQMKGAKQIVVTDWRKSQQLDSEVRQLAASLKIAVPFRNFAPFSQVWMLKTSMNGQLEYGVVSALAEVPYSSYFTVHQHITVNIVNEGSSKTKCLMSVYCSIVFNKSTYMKSTILSRTVNDLKEDYAIWIKNVQEILQKNRKISQDQIRMSRYSSNYDKQEKNSNSGKSEIMDKTGISFIKQKSMVMEPEKANDLEFQPLYKNGDKIVLENIKRLSGKKISKNNQQELQNTQQEVPLRQLTLIKQEIRLIKRLLLGLVAFNILQFIISLIY